MPEPEQKKEYLELFYVSENSVIGTVPIDRVKLVPRIGERIFLPLHHLGDWAEFKNVDIEYFLSTSQSQFGDPGTIRVALYAEKCDVPNEIARLMMAVALWASDVDQSSL